MSPKKRNDWRSALVGIRDRSKPYHFRHLSLPELNLLRALHLKIQAGPVSQADQTAHDALLRKALP